MFRLRTLFIVWNVFEVEPNKNWRLKSCKGLELMYKCAERTGTDVQNYSPWAAILASLFAQANEWELAFQIWKSCSLGCTGFSASKWHRGVSEELSTYVEKVISDKKLQSYYELYTALEVVNLVNHRPTGRNPKWSQWWILSISQWHATWKNLEFFAPKPVQGNQRPTTEIRIRQENCWPFRDVGLGMSFNY